VLRSLVKSENDPVASTVLGKWTMITHWGDKPTPFPPSALVFKKDGGFNWGDDDPAGWWIQNEGLLFFFVPRQLSARTHLHRQCNQRHVAGCNGLRLRRE
jgi:hypothetical protein